MNLNQSQSSAQRTKRDEAFAKELAGGGPVGEAFRNVSQAGCGADDLMRWLLKLHSESHWRPLAKPRTYFSKKERQTKLAGVAADLEAAAAELGGEAGTWIFALGDLRGDILGATSAQEAIALLRKLAVVVRNAIPDLRKVSTETASSSIAAIIEQVTRRTGRPHFAQMATLIGAACGRPDYSETDLKMLIARLIK